MSNKVYIACSLDGFIADKNGGLDWLMSIPNPDNSDFGFADFMNSVDGIIMGRVTFETVQAFAQWPYTKKVFVLSNSMKDIPEGYEGKIELITGNLLEIVDELNVKGYKDLYIDGGKTIQSFLREDLIDELIITRIPTLLGGGSPLFSDLNKELKFEYIKTEEINSFATKAYYTRKR